MVLNVMTTCSYMEVVTTSTIVSKPGSVDIVLQLLVVLPGVALSCMSAAINPNSPLQLCWHVCVQHAEPIVTGHTIHRAGLDQHR